MNWNLQQGWCGEDDFCWRGETQTEDGTLYLWVENEAAKDVPPADFQLALLSDTVEKWQKCKQVAVAYVRERMRSNPEEYGLEVGTPREDDGPDWLNANLNEYLKDFKLRQIGIPKQAHADQTVYMGFETHMDLEHGCVVELINGQPVREGMAADFGKMLILQLEAYGNPQWRNSPMTEWISLGFALVTPHTLQGWEDKFVPPQFYTLSACLCDIYPDSYWLGWNNDIVDTAQYDTLGLRPEQGAELSQWLQALFIAERWGLDSVFVHLEDAQEFIQRWASHLTGLEILEMALPIDYLEDFLRVHVLENGKTTHGGRHFAALLGRSPLLGQQLGFEVLGVSHWGDAHTSACSDIRQTFREGVGATFNAHGFLTTLPQAERAAHEYMFDVDGSGIEDCDWFPIQVTRVIGEG